MKSLVGHPSVFQPHRNFPAGGGVTTYRSNFLRPSFPAPPASSPSPRFSRRFAVATLPPAVALRLILRRGNDLRPSSTLRPCLPLIPPPQFSLDSSAAHHFPSSPPALSSRDCRRSNFPATLRRVSPRAFLRKKLFGSNLQPTFLRKRNESPAIRGEATFRGSNSPVAPPPFRPRTDNFHSTNIAPAPSLSVESLLARRFLSNFPAAPSP